jgi:hypothetical protein
VDPNEAFRDARGIGYRLDESNSTNMVWYDPDGHPLAAFADYTAAKRWMAERLNEAASD